MGRAAADGRRRDERDCAPAAVRRIRVRRGAAGAQRQCECRCRSGARSAYMRPSPAPHRRPRRRTLRRRAAGSWTVSSRSRFSRSGCTASSRASDCTPTPTHCSTHCGSTRSCRTRASSRGSASPRSSAMLATAATTWFLWRRGAAGKSMWWIACRGVVFTFVGAMLVAVPLVMDPGVYDAFVAQQRLDQ